MNAVVSVSYCNAHVKGAAPWAGGTRLDGALHARWLEEACGLYLDGVRSDDGHLYEVPAVVIVSTAFDGILHVEAGEERDALWRCARRGVGIMGDAANPNHQVGAALCLRLGLEYAGKLGHDYLVHTAEDVLPRPGALAAVLHALADGSEYAGYAWGVGTPAEGLNAQFFACRVPYLAGKFDPAAVTGAGHIEGYLRDLLAGKKLWLAVAPEVRYRHTHDYEEWKRWKGEQDGLAT